MTAVRPLSLRWRLAATYAGIALLTALVLGGLLLAIMGASFARADADRLRSVADRAAENVAAARGGDVQRILAQVAYGMNTRVQALAADGSVVADSGSPQDVDPASFGGDRAPGTASNVAPPNPDESRSPQQAEVAALPGSPVGIVALRASEGPASGGGVLRQVAVAWALAAVVAVVAAALLGYLLSARLTRPLVQLAAVTDRMAAGDLAARATPHGSTELGRLAASFNTMAARVEETVGSLRRFVSDAAHQLGTPLTALRTDLELLQDGAADADARRLAERALTQEQRLEDLGTGLLRLSRLDAPRAPHRSETVDLLGVVTAAVDAVASRADQAGISVTVDPGPPVTVRGDVEQLRVAVDNLLDNAVKFAAPGGTVTAGVAAVGPYAVAHVTDDGPGIAAADRPYVFDRFYRARATSDRPGTGLGLAIVQGVAEAHGGSVRLAEVTRGTRVELLVPRHIPGGV